MSEPTVERLFDEFAQAYRRGEHPDVGAYLARAGAERDDLGSMLDRFLQAVPAREPSEEEIVLMQARLEQEPPLLVLRLRRRLSRGAVVDAIVSTLGLDPAKREKVAGYYHRLEVGTLDPNPVSSRVWDALGGFMHANVRALAGPRPQAPAVEALYRRADADFMLAAGVDEKLVRRQALKASVEPDEIDRLFLGPGEP